MRTPFYLLIIFFLFYLIRLYQAFNYPFKSQDQVKIKTILSAEPQFYNYQQKFKIKGITVISPSIPRLTYGDKIEVIGIIEKTKTGLIPQYQLNNPQIIQISPTSLTQLNKLFKFRQKLVGIMQKALPSNQASLLVGILLGVKQNFSSSFYQALKNSGTLHLVVASGMNISLLAGALKEFLSRFISRKPSLIVSLVTILIYCFVAGMQPPIIRASLMAATLYLAQMIGREGIGLWLLIIAGNIMLLTSPLLIADPGFQLSFMATLGLIIFAPKVAWFVKKKKWPHFFQKEFSETFSATIFTIPILLISFGQLNLIAILPNLLLTWLIPFILYLGLMISFFGLIFFPLGQFFSLLIYLPLSYCLYIINFFGALPSLMFNKGPFFFLFTLGYYLIILSLVLEARLPAEGSGLEHDRIGRVEQPDP